jgi:exopolyphosphatase/guanosine-5'-triphosphate,3'-diphosphate pyrophosphatase
VDAKSLDALVEKVIPHSPEELAATYGMPFADAETLVPALLVYQALLRATRSEKMIVSDVTMRDGLLLDLPRYVTGVEDPGLTESIIFSARNIGAKYLYDAKHAEHVARISLRLFDEFQKEHGLTPRHRLLLHVAAVLHEVGKFVGNRSHHKHSWYLISNAEILGLRREDIAIVAVVARYHRRSTPKLSHPEYMALPREQRMVVNKLAAVLRVADALDRGHWSQVSSFQVERRDQDLVILAKGAGDLTLERRALADKQDLFEDIFGMRIRIEQQEVPSPAQ